MTASSLVERVGRRPVPVLVAGAVSISAAPILVKSLALGGLDPTAIAFWRCVLGLVFWSTPFVLRRRLPRLPRRTLALCALAGVLFAADLWAWHRAIVLAGAGLATILGNTQVFVSALLGIWIFRERPGRGFAGAAALAFAGVVLLVGVGGGVEFTRGYLVGIALGLATGLLYASFLIAMRAAGRGPDDSGLANARLFWFTTFAVVGIAVPWLIESRALPGNAAAWGRAALLALIAQTVGWWAIGVSLPRVRTALAGLILLLQPVLASLWGVWAFDEPWTALQAVGAVLTLAAIYFGSTRRQSADDPAPETRSARPSSSSRSR